MAQIISGSNMQAQFEERHLKFNYQPTTMNKKERIKQEEKYIRSEEERIIEGNKHIMN